MTRALKIPAGHLKITATSAGETLKVFDWKFLGPALGIFEGWRVKHVTNLRIKCC
jgi:hypothetical protein